MELYSFDAEYVRRLRAADPSVEEHFAGYFTQLLRIKLRARGASVSTIHDVTQETFYRVFKALRDPVGIQNPASLGAFVNSVCNNILLEQHRKTSRDEPLADDFAERAGIGPVAEEELITAETQATVREVLATLGDKDAQILRALFIEEQPKDELCRQFGVSRDYLRVLLHRAKQQFRRSFLKRADGEQWAAGQ